MQKNLCLRNKFIFKSMPKKTRWKIKNYHIVILIRRDVNEATTHEDKAEATTHEAKAEARTHEAEAEAKTHLITII